MKQLSLRYMKQGAAVSLLLFFGVLAHWAADWLNFYGSIAVSFISIGTILLTVINTYLWSWPILRSLYEFPDMRGTYEGHIKHFYYNDHHQRFEGTNKTIRIISQNGSGLHITSIIYDDEGNESSRSTADHVEIVKENEYTTRLTFHFKNEGNSLRGFPPHLGTEVLRFTKTKDQIILTGEYYTNRTPYQTKGKIQLSKSL